MNNMPPSYIPPAPPPRQGPSCWLLGGLACLGVIVLAVIAFIAVFVSFTHSPEGKKIFKSFGSAMQSAKMLPDCERNMMAIRDAIERYHTHTGHYPDTLKTLVPAYLPDGAVLHCPLDSNPDPAHVTYLYTKPTEATSDSAPLLTLNWHMTMSIGNQTQTTDTAIVLTRAGQLRQESTRSSTLSRPGSGS